MSEVQVEDPTPAGEVLAVDAAGVRQGDPYTWAAFAAGVVALAIGVVVVLWLQLPAAGLVSAAGAILLGIGLFLGKREICGGAIFLIGVTTLFTTHDQTQASELGLSAAYAFMCIVMLMGAELSFLTRRRGVIDSTTLVGFVSLHVLTATVALVGVVLLLMAMLGVTWPVWFLLVPAVAFAAGAIGGLRFSRTHGRRQAAVPMPPPPMLAVRRQPPPPPPSSQPPWSGNNRN